MQLDFFWLLGSPHQFLSLVLEPTKKFHSKSKKRKLNNPILRPVGIECWCLRQKKVVASSIAEERGRKANMSEAVKSLYGDGKEEGGDIYDQRDV
jgi:hypothetical protein